MAEGAFSRLFQGAMRVLGFQNPLGAEAYDPLAHLPEAPKAESTRGEAAAVAARLDRAAERLAAATGVEVDQWTSAQDRPGASGAAGARDR